jgi:hypothetical protein
MKLNNAKGPLKRPGSHHPFLAMAMRDPAMADELFSKA